MRQRITAFTADPAEFFRVINWCYDVANIGHHVRASVREQHCELRVTLRKTDPCLDRFAAEVADQSFWRVFKGEKVRSPGESESPATRWSSAGGPSCWRWGRWQATGSSDLPNRCQRSLQSSTWYIESVVVSTARNSDVGADYF